MLKTTRMTQVNSRETRPIAWDSESGCVMADKERLMAEPKHSIAENFERFFRVDIADTAELLDKVQYVRYRVYCEEFGFEPVESCPGQREKDAYDGQSIHCLITHLPSGDPAGCVRMVPTPDNAPKAQLPFEKFCGDSLDTALLEEMALDRTTICEISRLAVDRNFRRRSGEHETRFGSPTHLGFSEEEKRTLPFIAVSAYLAATAITHHTGRTNVFAMMEPFLPRLLNRAGIKFTRVGQDIDYHGLRAPYFIKTQSALNGMNNELKQLYEAIARQLYV
jgi:N-acyl amino acid synthase of PEP-CTERM/exosortase system